MKAHFSQIFTRGDKTQWRGTLFLATDRKSKRSIINISSNIRNPNFLLLRSINQFGTGVMGRDD